MILPDTPAEAHISILLTGCLLGVIDFGCFLLVWFWNAFPLFILMLVKVVFAHRYHYSMHLEFPSMFPSKWPSIAFYVLLVPIIVCNMSQWIIEWFILPDQQVGQSSSIALLSLWYIGLACHVTFFVLHLVLYFIMPPPASSRLVNT
jgi:hypothetical protein